jgi:hypothetical protein
MSVRGKRRASVRPMRATTPEPTPTAPRVYSHGHRRPEPGGDRRDGRDQDGSPRRLIGSVHIVKAHFAALVVALPLKIDHVFVAAIFRRLSECSFIHHPLTEQNFGEVGHVVQS